MSRTASEIETLFKKILKEIEEGTPLRQIIAATPGFSTATFYKWLDGSESMLKRYARAKELAAEALYDQIVEIARTPLIETIEETGNSGATKFDKTTVKDNVQRSRLMIDAIKWRLAKERPEKYGDKLDVTSGNKPLAVPAIVGMVIKNTTQDDEPSDYDLD